MKDELLKLADRVEALTDKDDWTVVDSEIVEMAWRLQLPMACYDGRPINYDPNLWQERYGFSPTTSIDAALMLVPDMGEIDGRRFDLSNFEKRAVARCYSDADTDHKSSAATAALALTAAALRALAQEQGDV